MTTPDRLRATLGWTIPRPLYDGLALAHCRPEGPKKGVVTFYVTTEEIRDRLDGERGRRLLGRVVSAVCGAGVGVKVVVEK